MRGVRERRMIRRSISTSRKVNRTGPLGALLFTWLCLHCDDHGRLEGDPYTIKIKVVPGLAEFTEDVIAELLGRMHAAKLIVWYQVDEEQYIEIPQWCEIQSWGGVTRQPSDIPEPYEGSTVISGPVNGKPLSSQRSPEQDKTSQDKEPPPTPAKGGDGVNPQPSDIPEPSEGSTVISGPVNGKPLSSQRSLDQDNTSQDKTKQDKKTPPTPPEGGDGSPDPGLFGGEGKPKPKPKKPTAAERRFQEGLKLAEYYLANIRGDRGNAGNVAKVIAKRLANAKKQDLTEDELKQWLWDRTLACRFVCDRDGIEPGHRFAVHNFYGTRENQNMIADRRWAKSVNELQAEGAGSQGRGASKANSDFDRVIIGGSP